MPAALRRRSSCSALSKKGTPLGAFLDIAGMAWQNKDKPVCPKGATAFGVQLLNTPRGGELRIRGLGFGILDSEKKKKPHRSRILNPECTFAMTEIRFYHLTRKALDQVLPELLEKTLSRAIGMKAVVMAGSPERVEALTQHLWVYHPNKFLPHGSPKDGNAVRCIRCGSRRRTSGRMGRRFYFSPMARNRNASPP